MFNNHDSQELFIPKDAILDEVIKQDTRELEQIGGSFEAIADRMDQLIETAEGIISQTPRGQKCCADVEPNLRFRGYVSTRGLQFCPFSDCRKSATESREYQFMARASGKSLTINRITSHLARHHSLLEKGNQYGIGAREFYEHFMPEGCVNVLMGPASPEVNAVKHSPFALLMRQRGKYSRGKNER
ncbi:hypothetical protein HN592_02820 [Candidatus Woesearchaeota archaeon]|jgi:hypothetical protein|nr:hypothetical protein [Candidatus Woesearchaeota archaeon]MBT4368145.1 hypothetical protein [Candidatus Woesearchaeota archaeon]MBT4712633.1 hypothetical protein [Candidatus Woesearchaeota archaeon]MBT6639546.1 hypothetical protein [Candidatus Woesearchaeota archaeon]MBT7133718.1 hypothetical protein [Candidatus Woesearchaeota archaeon]